MMVLSGGNKSCVVGIKRANLGQVSTGVVGRPHVAVGRAYYSAKKICGSGQGLPEYDDACDATA